MVPHQALLNKLHHLNVPLTLLSNYLSGRLQRVVLNGISSSWLPAKSGVQQGSVLWPLLFLLYTDKLCHLNTSTDTNVSFGFIFHKFSPHCSPDAITKLHKAQVLPILDYACTVRDPHFSKDKLTLESIQLMAARMASKTWHSGSTELNKKVSLPTLSLKDAPISNYFQPTNC